MSYSPIKVVFFDAAGTLIHINGSVADVYLQYAKKYGVQPTPDLKSAIQSAFSQAFQQAPPAIFHVSQPEKLKQCERLWWFDIVHAVFYRVGMFERFDDYFEEVYEAFGTGLHWKADPEVFPVLQTLKDLGYELGIISNFDTRLFQILDDLSLRSFFDTVTISSLVQSVKPSKQIFHFALNEHVVEPHEALHIGDSVKDDWEGAVQAGLHAVLLNGTGKSSHSAQSIQSFTQLPELLRKFSSNKQ
ncbi:HAD-IA family hydrolase [Candidatus Nitrospira salsa]